MSTVRVTRRAGVRIPTLGSRDFGETFEVDQYTARQLDKLPGLTWEKTTATPEPEPEPDAVEETEQDDAS